jgi:hypothetical protein
MLPPPASESAHPCLRPERARFGREPRQRGGNALAIFSASAGKEGDLTQAAKRQRGGFCVTWGARLTSARDSGWAWATWLAISNIAAFY